MKIIKPQKLGLLTRTIEFRGRFRLGLSILMHVPLTEVADLYSEVSLWKLAAEELGAHGVVDQAIPKLKGEFLVQGRAFPGGQRPAPGCKVRAQVAGVGKSLHVIGDREWIESGRASEPLPFHSVDLTWERAFGGADFAGNPVGKGHGPVIVDGVRHLLLPNVTYPHDTLRSVDDHPAIPAGMGAIDMTWAPRAGRMGTYGSDWLQRDYPGYAQDIDWLHFNTAPADQWLDLPVAADAAYEFENLHESIPLLQGRLPGFAARCLVGRGELKSPRLREVTMQLATLWCFPHRRRAILVYQGHCEVNEEDASDVTLVLAAAECAARPRPTEHYVDAVSRRLDPENGHLASLMESELVPQTVTAEVPDLDEDRKLFGSTDLLRDNAKRRHLRETEAARAEVARHGLDPDEHGPPLPRPDEPLPTLEQLPEAVARMTQQAQQIQAGAMARKAEVMAAAEVDYKAAGLDFRTIEDEVATRPSGPPTFRARQQVDSLRTLGEMFKNDPVATQELAGYWNDPEWVARQQQAEADARTAYRMTAHLQAPVTRLSPEQSAAIREQLAQARVAGRPLHEIDMTGADLSGLNLDGADLQGAFMEGVDLSGASMVGCNLSDAVLTRARLFRTNLSQSSLVRANLGGCEAEIVRADDVDLSETILDKATLRRVSMRGARLKETGLQGIRLDEVDLSGAVSCGQIFIDLDLRYVRFEQAKLPDSVLIRCDLSGASLRGACLAGSALFAVRAVGTVFDGADLSNLRCVERCQLGRASLVEARLTGANLRGTDLGGVCLDRAELEAADLSDCNLADASLEHAQARAARFVKSQLQRSRWGSANLAEATLQRSQLQGADLRGANLFQSDLARVQVDEGVRWDGAFTERARTIPKAAPPERGNHGS